MPAYIELHARSAFSFLQGAAVPEDYADHCAKFEQPGMALLDADGFYGSPRFHQAMSKAGLTAYVGADLGCTDGARYPLLAMNQRGYRNLSRLISRAKLRVPKNDPTLVTPEELEEFAGDWICLAGGELATRLDQVQHIFGKKNVYLELQRHFDRQEEARNQAIIELARAKRVPLVATNGVCYAEPSQREILDVFTCLRHHTTLAQAGRLLEKNSERHMKSTRQMMELFADVPDAIHNTSEIASRLEFTLKDLGYQFPKYPVRDGQTEAGFLRKLTEDRARNRYGVDQKAQAQIAKELALIEKLDRKSTRLNSSH